MGDCKNNNNLKVWCHKHRIVTKPTVPYHHKTNAPMERLNRTLQDIARTAMLAASLKLWGDAIQWAAYTKNQIPHKALTNGKNPTKTT